MNNSREKIRQEKESFNVRKLHVQRMNKLKLVMGYSSIVILVVILISCLYIFFDSKMFDRVIVDSATKAFFIDLIALIFLTYKMVLFTKEEKLEPTIRE